MSLVIVLGAPKLADDTPGPDLKARLDRSLALYRASNAMRLLVTGGNPKTYGSQGELAEGVVMRAYLEAHGVPRAAILAETEARGTFGNAVNSRQLLEPQLPTHITLVTHDWHAARARLCFESVFGADTIVDVDAVASDPLDAQVVERKRLEHEMLGRLVARLKAEHKLPPLRFAQRRATRGDAQRVFELVNEAYAVETGDTGVAFKKTSRFISVAEAERCIDAGLVLVTDARSGAELYGCVCVQREPERPGVADMGPVAVARALQGRGLGKQIITEVAVPFAREQLGAHTLEITVVNVRSDLFPMYEKLGFRHTGTLEFRDVERLTRPVHFCVMQLPLAAAR